MNYLLVFKSKRTKGKLYQAKVSGNSIVYKDSMAFVWQFYEIFHKRFYAFKSMTESPRIIDCGSNIGLSCLFYLKNYPDARITAIEPSPEIVELIEQNITTNNWKLELITKAAWLSNKGVQFNTNESDSGAVVDKGELHLPSFSFREFLQKEEKVDFLKMDIEGAEVAVLKDCQGELYKVQNLFVEYHSYDGSKQELGETLALLSKAGFRYYLENTREQFAPLISRKKPGSMDLQVNIFAWKEA